MSAPPVPAPPPNVPGWFLNLWTSIGVKDLLSFGWMAVLTALVSLPIIHPPTPPTPTPPAPTGIAFTQSEYKALPGEFADLEVNTDGTNVGWIGEGGLQVRVTDSGAGKTASVVASKPGVYKVHAHTFIKGKAVHDHATITVGTPVPPVPPTPPTPPTPPNPIPGQGLHVLMVFDNNAKGSYTKGQLDTLDGADVRAYLQSHCEKGPDGKTAEFRILDKDTDMSKESDFWKKAMTIQRGTLPWIIIGNGDKGFSGPIPAGGAMDLIKQYGG